MPAKSNPPLKTPSRRLALFTWLGAFWFSALAVPVCSGQNATAALRVQPTPAAVLDILEIHPFRLGTGYDYAWLESRPFVSDGLLVVLKVDPSLVVPRNTGEPVLYAGDRTVQRLNQGNGSGYVIGIIPGEIDLTAEPIWFGRPQLPERVTPEVIKEQRALADSAGIKPFSPDKIDAVRRAPIEAGDLAELLRGLAADLVLNYAPDEKDLAVTWRLPTTGSKVSQ
jgi:hypothetical protein